MSRKESKLDLPQSQQPGITFEEAVTVIQEMMDPNASVTHNELITDRHGHKRQFDVVIRGKVGGHPVLGVIECKALRRKVGTPCVDAFVTKARDINASIKLIASKRGFTKPALEKARDYGVSTISLLPKDFRASDVSIGMYWYAELYKWTKALITVYFAAQKPPITHFEVPDVKRGGRPVIEWFQKELVTTYVNEERTGWISVKVTFDKTRRFQIKKRQCLVKAITFHALQTCTRMKKWIKFRGHGFYDWDKKKITIPPRGSVYTAPFRTDFSDWEEFEGDIPPSTSLIDCRLKVRLSVIPPDMTVVDLSNL
jgi:hypothetical protein